MHPLDRLDELASLVRLALIDMSVVTSIPSPSLRSEAFAACVAAGLLVSPIGKFRSDLDAVIQPLVDRDYLYRSRRQFSAESRAADCPQPGHFQRCSHYPDRRLRLHHSMPWDEMIPLSLTSVCKRRSKNRSYDAARAGYYGGVKVDHRRRLSFMSCCGTAEFMEHRKDVQGGALRSCAACGSKRCGGLFPALSLAVSLSCSHCVIYRSLVGQASPNLVAASIATRSPDSENEPLRSVKSSKIV